MSYEKVFDMSCNEELFEVYYFKHGFHAKRYKYLRDAVDAFSRIPAYNSPHIKKL